MDYSSGFKTDARWWNEAHRNNLEEMARKYWEGGTGGEYPEVIVQGRVTVIRELDPFENRSKMCRMVKKLDRERLAASILACAYSIEP